jgi:surface antigen
VVTVGRAGILVLLLVAACWGFLPLADARGSQLRPGPSAEAYPLAGQRGPALDPWGFVARQCTSYAAWYLNAHGVPFRVLTRGPGGEGLFTSARSWDRAAATAGFAVRSTPAVGSIAQWDPGESSPPAPAGDRSPAHHQHDVVTAGRYGHVAVVRRVLRDGAVVVSEYNGADGRFHVQVTRAPRYLYIGVPTGLE